MSNFLRPIKKNLKNAQHYSLMEAFKTVFTEAGFTPAKLVALFTVFVNCFQTEDRYYMLARASEVIARRNEADNKRDTMYTKLYALVRLWLNTGNALMEAAAEALSKPFKLYAVKTSAQIDQESGQLDNLITDLSTAEMQAHIETIGGKWLFDQMKAAHDEVKSIRLEQGNEESEKVAGALVKARKACDEAYDNLITAVEAFATIADDPAPYEAFIKRWNGTLKIYQDLLNRKSGKTGGTNADDDDNENSGTGTGTITPDTPGTDTPGTDTPGSGDNTGGGSDNGGSDNGGSGDNGGGGDDGPILDQN